MHTHCDFVRTEFPIPQPGIIFLTIYSDPIFSLFFNDNKIRFFCFQQFVELNKEVEK